MMAERSERGTSLEPDERCADVAQPAGYPIPAQPECDCPAIAKAWGIVGVVLGIIGFFIQPLVFGPMALTAGIVSVRMRFRLGWLGVGLGAVQLVYVAMLLSQINAD